MEKVYIQWNLVNWITIVLMVALGSALVGFVVAQIKNYHAPMPSGDAS